MFETTIPRAGTYQLACTGEGGPATIAIGQGFIGGILVIALGAVGAFLGAGVTVLLVHSVRRRRRRARAVDQTSPPAPVA